MDLLSYFTIAVSQAFIKFNSSLLNATSISLLELFEISNNGVHGETSCHTFIFIHQIVQYIGDLTKSFSTLLKEKRDLKSELEAIQDLLKGKTTTMPKMHSGEGIFFTSKIAFINVS